MNDDELLLIIRRIRKEYGKHVVLNEIDLTVCRGEVVCLLGHSGSGKTTLLRCVNQLVSFDSGEIEIRGRVRRVIRGTKETRAPLKDKFVAEYRTHIGMVFQRFNLFEHLSVIDNVTVGPRKVLRMGKNEATEWGRTLLKEVGLLERQNFYPRQLSGGQQQRVAIARALAMRPEIMLFDEPTSALDPELVGEVLDTMKRLASDGMTMLIATHEMGFARDVGTRAVFLQKGRIVEEGASDDFFTHPRREETKRFLARLLKSEGRGTETTPTLGGA